MEALLSTVGLERITPKCIYLNVCYKERSSRTNYVRSSIPHCICKLYCSMYTGDILMPYKDKYGCLWLVLFGLFL
jgi:hypothetical protein